MLRAITVRYSWALCVLAACHGTPRPPSGRALSQPTAVASTALTPARFPRPVLPQSAAMLFGSEVFFRWLGTGAHAELARDRAFSSVVQSSAADVTQTVLHVPPGIWFWRVVDRSGHASAVWPFEVMPGAGTGHASSLLLAADFNGDMRADLVVGAGVVLGNPKPPVATDVIDLDSGTLKIPELVRAKDEPEYMWNTGVAAGDIDGDGYGDMSAQVERQATNIVQRIAVTLLFKGGPQISKRWTASERMPHYSAARLGDVNEDGYADTLECLIVPDHAAGCSIYAGSAQGLSVQPLLALPVFQYVLTGTDLDGDDHADLVGVTAAGTVTVYLGPLNGPNAQGAKVWSVPHVQYAALGDLDGDGRIDIWGVSVAGASDLSVWEIPGKEPSTSRAVLNVVRASVPWGGNFAFVPGVGSNKAGLLTLSTGGIPSFTFAQAAYPLALTLARAVTRASHADAPELGVFNVSALQSIGDYNGDGWSDLLVTRSTDAQDVSSEVYLGGSRLFVIRSPGAGFMSGGYLNF